MALATRLMGDPTDIVRLRDIRDDPHEFWSSVRSRGPVVREADSGAWLVVSAPTAVDTLSHPAASLEGYRSHPPSGVVPESSFLISADRSRAVRRAALALPAALEPEVAALRTHACSLANGLQPGEQDLHESFVAPLDDWFRTRWIGLPADDLAYLVAASSALVRATDEMERRCAAIVLTEGVHDTLVALDPTTPGLAGATMRLFARHGLDVDDVCAFLGPTLQTASRRQSLQLLTHAIVGAVEEGTLMGGPTPPGPLVSAAIVREASRWEPVNQVVPRIADDGCTIGGVTPDRGDLILVVLSAACRDPGTFAEPDRFTIQRKTPALAFGSGPRRCAGMAIATTVASIALDALVAHWRVESASMTPRFGTGYGRTFTSAPATLTARSAPC